MRKKLRNEIVSTRDAGLIPEAMYDRLAAGKTVYEYPQSGDYPIERVVDLADRATSRDPAALPDLLAALDDPHPVVRYWGAMGCLVLQQKAMSAKAKLPALLKDDWTDVRVTAAEALGYLGETDAALAALSAVVESRDDYEQLAALNALDFLQAAGNAPLGRVQASLRGRKFSATPARISEYLLGLAP